MGLQKVLTFHSLIFQILYKTMERSKNIEDKTKEILKVRCCEFRFLRLFGLFSLH
ncbi:hypothetical protein LBBP_01804 [Leptospira borgpetersenii serovar Ballum]|uniref:Uncharacterized protein n=1 Tax=Leptospira borgpetersenii serovar Ballum TaxID=280505 RepID=A0A0S2IRE1_LEPBO|nr:hypothetical protein LBBP_01804 [Leptospira borgpetersenii serovar Ballum]